MDGTHGEKGCECPVKKLVCWLVVAASLSSLTACGVKTPQERIAKELGLDATDGTEVLHYDSHSGNGDGASCYALQFSDYAMAESIRDQAGWASLPMDETTTLLVYGQSDNACCVGPYLTDSSGSPLLPEIENGYYRFIDRQADDKALSSKPILERSSYNFTVAVYDEDLDILYYCHLDT